MQSTFGIKNNPYLTDLQKTVMAEFTSIDLISKNFYLTGGTALSAFYFYHRYSEDLDFFTHDQELDFLPSLFPNLFKKLNIPYQHLTASPYFHRILVDNSLKMDFVKDTAIRIGAPKPIENLLIDTLDNIASNKMCTILSRLEVKDYVDLYFIFKTTDLKIETLFEQAKLKDGGMDVFMWSSLIKDVETFELLPRMIKPLKLEELKHFFLELRDTLLLSLKPKQA